jgi:plastocyanin
MGVVGMVGYTRKLVCVGVVTVAAAAFGACSSDGGKKVNVVLSEFVVQPDKASIEPGDIKFNADNQGTETHEMVVVKADSAEALPTDADGAVDEEQFEKGQAQGEVEDVAKGTSKSIKLKLTPGRYIVFCNIVEEEGAEKVSHFKKGMHAVLTVQS